MTPDRFEIVGETYSDDPRERRLRVVAQMIDKPLYVVLAVLALVAVDGLGEAIPGYEPSVWFGLGLWIAALIALRLIVVAGLRAFRRAYDIPAPRRTGGERGPEQE